MPTTKATNRPKTVRKAKEVVLSIRLDAATVGMLDELARETDRSRSGVAARAIREYVEGEFAVLTHLREGEKDLAEGRSVSVEEARDALMAHIAGRQPKPDAA